MVTTSLVMATTQGRYDLYGPIHKGLRRAHGLMLARLGSADYEEVNDLLADLRAHLALAEIHLADEEAFIHEALRAHAPSGTDRLEEQHADHRASFAMIEVAIRAVEGAPSAAEAAASGRQLYLSFSRFVAEDLEHMAVEECETWPLLCTLFTDAELQQLEMAIVSNLDPATNMAFLRHIMPATNHGERAAMLGGMKAGMPPHIYAAVIEQAVLPDLGARARDRLATAGLLA